MKRKMNKKGATFLTFLEVMLFSVLFIGALAVIGTNMNNIYGDNKDMTFGIVSNSTLEGLKSTSNTLDESLKGETSFSSLGFFTIVTLPKMIMSMVGLIRDFVLGNWINKLVELMNLGDYTNLVIGILKILYFFILILIIIKIITRSFSV